jgi:predicted PurR-regulated permease PerM
VHLLAVLVFVAGCWAGKELLVPVLLALFLSLVANPLVWKLQQIGMPRWIAAIFVVFGGVALALTLATQLATPAGDWLQRAPTALREVAPKLKGLVKQVNEANKAAASVVSAASAATSTGSRAQAAAMAQAQPKAPNVWSLIRGAPRLLAIVGAVILLSYFFVVYGVDLQRRAIALLAAPAPEGDSPRTSCRPSSSSCRATCSPSASSTSCSAAWWRRCWSALGLDLGDALLWGALGGLLNFAPYVGPVIGVTMLAAGGRGRLRRALAHDPAAAVLPRVAAAGVGRCSRRSSSAGAGRSRRWWCLLWLLFCGWLWSIPGVLLAVPILVCFKIVTERVESLKGWSKVIE